MAESCLTIHKLSLDTQLIHLGNQVIAHPEAVKRRLERLAETSLIKNLQEQLSPLDGDNHAVVIVKKLDIDFNIDLLLSEREIGQIWSEEIKKAIISTLYSQKNQQLVTFPNQADYLKHFIIDLLEGRAWQRWYYNRFKSLKVLPLSSVLRTLLIDDIENAISALQKLDIQWLRKVSVSLTLQDINIVQKHWLNAVERVQTLSINSEAIAAKVAGIVVKSQLFNLEYGQRIFFRALAALSQSDIKEIKAIFEVSKWIDILDKLLQHPNWNEEKLIQCLTSKKISEISPEIGSSNIEVLLSLVELPEKVIGNLINEIEKVDYISEKQRISNYNDLRFSQFGNVLLLLPNIEKLLAHCSVLGEYPFASALKLLVLSLCQGANKFEMAFNDALLQDLCGFKQWDTLANVFSYLEKIPKIEVEKYFSTIKKTYSFQEKNQIDSEFLLITDNVLQSVNAPSYEICTMLVDFSYIQLCLFARRLPGFSQSSLPYLWTNFLSMSVNMNFEEKSILAHLSKVPMSVLLNMTGINRGQLLLPMFDKRPILYSEVG